MEPQDPGVDPAALQRFSGFAGLYDAARPSPPAALGPLLALYADASRPTVVDLGSGTGLSSRWAASWAGSVTGIEPNDEMRAVAESRPTAGVEYRPGRAERTCLPAAGADVVLAVQAMHWMDPGPTLAEVGRILGPGGVMAAIDADWPPVSGLATAERAWETLHGRIRVLEARLARGETGRVLLRPIDPTPLTWSTTTPPTATATGLCPAASAHGPSPVICGTWRPPGTSASRESSSSASRSEGAPIASSVSCTARAVIRDCAKRA